MNVQKHETISCYKNEFKTPINGEKVISTYFKIHFSYYKNINNYTEGMLRAHKPQTAFKHISK